MAKPGAGRQPRTRREILSYGRKLGGVIVEGGPHTKIYNPRTNQSTEVPRHNNLNKWTAVSIVGQLKAMFLVVLLFSIPACLLILPALEAAQR